MLAAMRPSQLGEWLALYDIDPWGEQRADLRAGIVAAEVHNAAGSKRKDNQPITADQFMPYVERKTVSLAEKAKAVLKSAAPSKKKTKG
jgi:hypothetical protein